MAAPYTLNLSAVSGTGPGAIVDLSAGGGAPQANPVMAVISSAGVSAGSVQLEGSTDGVAWYNVGTAVSTNAASTAFAPVSNTGVAARYVRANVKVAITGGTVSAWVGAA